MIGSSRTCSGFAIGMLLTCVLGSAAARPMPAQKCAASKLKAAGGALRGYGKCDAEGQGPTNDACSAKVLAKFTAKFTATEAKGGCATTGDLPVTQATVDRCREAFSYTFSLQGVPGADCGGDKLKALGKAAMAKAKCHQKAILGGTAVDPNCLQTATDKLAAAVAKADLRVPGGCYGPPGDLGTLSTACADQLRSGPSATGCFDESREGLVGFTDVAACAGTPPVSFVFGSVNPHCAPGWRVCRFDDDAVHTVTYADATAFPGCYGFDAADNFDTCQDCVVGIPMNQSGMGSACGYLRPFSTSCLADGRVTVTPISSLLGCGVGPSYSTTGVVCCDTGIPGTTTTTSTMAGVTTTSATTTTIPTGPGCCDDIVGGISYCVAPSDVDDCFTRGGTFHAGWACDGASGACAPTRSGAGVCCQESLLGFGCIEVQSSCPPIGGGTWIPLPGGACQGNTGYCDNYTTTTTTLPPTHCCDVNSYLDGALYQALGCFDQADSDGECPFTIFNISGSLAVGSDPGPFGTTVCNGVTGRCDFVDQGNGTCCQVDGPGLFVCSDATATGVAFCPPPIDVSPYSLTPFVGATCTYQGPGTYACQ